jgi:hypothetical protein
MPRSLSISRTTFCNLTGHQVSGLQNFAVKDEGVHVYAEYFLLFFELLAIKYEGWMIRQRAWAHSHSEVHDR